MPVSLLLMVKSEDQPLTIWDGGRPASHSTYCLRFCHPPLLPLITSPSPLSERTGGLKRLGATRALTRSALESRLHPVLKGLSALVPPGYIPAALSGATRKALVRLDGDISLNQGQKTGRRPGYAVEQEDR